MRKKTKKRSVAATRVTEEPKSYASVYAAKLAKQVAEFAPRQSTAAGKKGGKSGR